MHSAKKGALIGAGAGLATGGYYGARVGSGLSKGLDILGGAVGAATKTAPVQLSRAKHFTAAALGAGSIGLPIAAATAAVGAGIGSAVHMYKKRKHAR